MNELDSLKRIIIELSSMNRELQESVDSLWKERHIHLEMINRLTEQLSSLQHKTPLELAIEDFCVQNHNLSYEYVERWFKAVFDLGAKSIKK